jgi:hypothetical protein
MRHGKKFNHLGRTASHRKAMLSNMAASLITHKRINTTLAEWTAESLAIVYNPGNNTTAATGSGSGVRYIGIGRQAGYIYTTTTADVIPYLTADAGRGAFFERVTPVGEFTVDHKADTDRLFACEWVCLVKESNTDGELIGKIRLP